MNPYVWETTCKICGGKGMTTSDDFANGYFGSGFAHKNPNVCRQILESKADDLKKREVKLLIKEIVK